MSVGSNKTGGVSARVWRVLRRLARNPKTLYGLPLLLALFLCVVPSVVAGVPIPAVDDEFGYLLTAETFRHGRLTNPTPEHAAFFETRHQLVEPTRQAKYPPGQGAILALGSWLGHPIFGVWLGCLAMVLACSWLLRAVMPAVWTLVGGLLTALLFVGQGIPWGGHVAALPAYWAHSYWGGALAATGGALVYGACIRITRGPTFAQGLWLGIGLVTLVVTRPKEGFLFSLPAAGMLAIWLWRGRSQQIGPFLTRVAVPVIGCLSALTVGLAVYNQAVTGNWKLMPWVAHYDKYVVFPMFIWQDLQLDRAWSHQDLSNFHNGWERALHERHQGLFDTLFVIKGKVTRFGWFFFGPVLALCIVAFPKMLRRRFVLLAAIVVMIATTNVALSFSDFPHYNAPVTGLCLLLGVSGLRYLRSYRRWGRSLSLLALCACAVGTGVSVTKAVQHIRMDKTGRQNTMRQDLMRRGGKHLVFVRFTAEYPIEGKREWVHNPVDLDAAPILWVRDFGNARNTELRQQYVDRKAWRVKAPIAIEGPVELEPFE